MVEQRIKKYRQRDWRFTKFIFLSSWAQSCTTFPSLPHSYTCSHLISGQWDMDGRDAQHPGRAASINLPREPLFPHHLAEQRAVQGPRGAWNQKWKKLSP